MAGETLTNPVRRMLSQIVCSMCKGRRFFVYVVEGEVQLACTECGAMGAALDRQTPAQS